MNDGVLNHQPYQCLLKRLFGRRSKKTSKLRITGFCAGNSPVTGDFPAQMASDAENVSIWWRHHENRNWPTVVDKIVLKIIVCNFPAILSRGRWIIWERKYQTHSYDMHEMYFMHYNIYYIFLTYTFFQ